MNTKLDALSTDEFSSDFTYYLARPKNLQQTHYERDYLLENITFFRWLQRK